MQKRAELAERIEILERELRDSARNTPTVRIKFGRAGDISDAMAGIDRDCALSLKAKRPEARIGAWRASSGSRRAGSRGRMMDRKLKEIGDSRPDEAHELKMRLDDIHRQIEESDREIRGAEGERSGAKAERALGRRPGGEVDRLRGEVNELRIRWAKSDNCSNGCSSANDRSNEKTRRSEDRKT